MRPLITGESSRLLSKSWSYLLVTMLSISVGQSRRKDIESRKNGRNSKYVARQAVSKFLGASSRLSHFDLLE